MKRELMLTRIAQRFGLRAETRTGRGSTSFAERRGDERTQPAASNEAAAREGRARPAAPLERELLEVLLADAGAGGRGADGDRRRGHRASRAAATARGAVRTATTPRDVADLDALRLQLADRPAAGRLGVANAGSRPAARATGRPGCEQILHAVSRPEGEADPRVQVQSKLTATKDHAAALELLRHAAGAKPAAAGMSHGWSVGR